MEKLNYPIYNFRTKIINNKRYIFDEVRRDFFLLTDEEWVRQHVIHSFICRGISKTRIVIEKQFKLNGNIKKRFDIMITGKKASIILLVECKSPKVKINQSVFDQIAIYQSKLNSKYLLITNGNESFYFKKDDKKNHTVLLMIFHLKI
jgi:hypothetical protein